MGSMRKWGMAAGAVGFLILQMPALAQEEEAPKAQYVGVENCGKCHKSERKGDQLGKWEASRHSKAYATLASEQAKEIAAKKEIDDPQKSDKCLKCHVTAHGVDAALIQWATEEEKGHRIEDGVGCESCHGAGSLYMSRSVMKDREASLANGLVLPDEKVCKQCHNEESPTYEAFKYEEMLAKIAHPNPLKAEGGEE